MNGSAVKASNREIRRAFGHQATELLEKHELAIDKMRYDASVERASREEAIRAVTQQRDLDATKIRDLEAFAARSLWQHLRYALFGK